MADEQAQAADASIFEQIRYTDETGAEYWSARELAVVLGYATSHRNFIPVIAKAQIACESSGHAALDHFAHVRTMITAGKGARRSVQDTHLSRYACYLVVQNADPEKEVVALGQTYFAVQTRRAELHDSADALADLSEVQRRLFLRGQVRVHNITLSDAARGAGVITPKQFAIFQDHGYRGLYSGETARDIAIRKGLHGGQHILDHMGSEELAANMFRITQAEAKILREGITDREAANRAHFEVGAIVRRTIIEELGGTPPEQLPTPLESIQQLQRREQQRLPSERQPSLFGPLDERAD